jgi:hypothetical protein
MLHNQSQQRAAAAILICESNLSLSVAAVSERFSFGPGRFVGVPR